MALAVGPGQAFTLAPTRVAGTSLVVGSVPTPTVTSAASSSPTAPAAPATAATPTSLPTPKIIGAASLRLVLRRAPGGSGYQLVTLPPTGTETPPAAGSAAVVDETVAAGPASVSQWWDSLSAVEQTTLETSSPDMLRGLDGVPAVVRDRLNRAALAAAQTRMADELTSLATHPPKFDAVAVPDSGFGVLGPDLTTWENTFQLLQAQLTGMHDLETALTDPHMYLLYFDTQGRGHVAIAYGDPDTAANLAVVVPGTGVDLTTVGPELEHITQLGLAAQKDTGTPPASPSGGGSGLPAGAPDQPAVVGGERRRGDTTGTAVQQASSTAVVEWLAYDSPVSIADATSTEYAQNALPSFTSFMAGLADTHQGAPAHTTVIGHSYGSLLVGMALARQTISASDVVIIGSPGVGVDNVAGLRMDPAHVWAATGGDDWIKTWALPFRTPTEIMNQTTLTFGADPHSPGFGAHLFDAGQASHAQYFDPAYPSLANMAAIVVGDYNAVTPQSGSS